MTYTGRTKLDRLADNLGDMIAKVDARSDLPDMTKYKNDILGFVADVLPNVQLWHKQRHILEAMQTGNRVCAYGANSTGKDYVAGVIGAWWIATRPGGRVIYQSAKENQVTEVCFRANLIPRIKDAGLPAECYTSAIRMGGETVALGMTSNMASRLTGFHAEGGVLLILSEAQGLDEVSWEGAYAVATSDLDAILAIGNPIAPVGSFYRASRSPHWASIQLSAKEHPNVTLGLKPGDDGFIPGGPGIGWVKEMRSALSASQYTARVEGQFPTESQHGLIRLPWLQEAARKWEAGELEPDHKEQPVFGVDVARYGVDATVVAIRHGYRLEKMVRWYDCDTVETTAQVKDLGLEYNVHPRKVIKHVDYPPVGKIITDEVGLGAGVFDQLKADKYRAEGFSGAKRARNHKRFENKRAESYWTFARLLEEGKVAIPHDDELWAELLAIEYTDETGRTKMEKKSELAARLGRSPDKADAVTMAFDGVGGPSREIGFFRFSV